MPFLYCTTEWLTWGADGLCPTCRQPAGAAGLRFDRCLQQRSLLVMGFRPAWLSRSVPPFSSSRRPISERPCVASQPFPISIRSRMPSLDNLLDPFGPVLADGQIVASVNGPMQCRTFLASTGVVCRIPNPTNHSLHTDDSHVRLIDTACRTPDRCGCLAASRSL